MVVLEDWVEETLVARRVVEENLVARRTSVWKQSGSRAVDVVEEF